MNIKSTLKTSAAAAALFAVAVPVTAGTVSNGNDTASITLSGHFNKALLWMDNGQASRVTVGDNNNSQSRARIHIKGKVNESINFAAMSEWGMGSNLSSNVSPSGPGVDAVATKGDDAFFTKRQSYIRMGNSKTIGSVVIGHGSEANDGITEASFTGAHDAVYAANTVVGNGIHLTSKNAVVNGTPYRTTGVGHAENATVGDLKTINGEGTRTDNIRYISPTFGGLSLQGSFQSDQKFAYGLRYGGKAGGFKVDARIGGYLGGGSTNDESNRSMGGSIAIAHDSGFNVRSSGGKSHLEKDTATRKADPWDISFGGGYKANLIATGSTNFAIDWSRYMNAGNDSNRMNRLALGVEQETDMGVKFYLGYQRFTGYGSFNLTDAEVASLASRFPSITVNTPIVGSFKAVSTVMAGTKVYF